MGRWEAEFRGNVRESFGKPHVNWNEQDYAALRLWIERCLPPIVASGSTRERFMSGIDRQLSQLKSRQVFLKQQGEADRRRTEEQERQQARFDTLQKRYEEQSALVAAASQEFQKKAHSFLMEPITIHVQNAVEALSRAQEVQRERELYYSRRSVLNAVYDTLYKEFSFRPPTPKYDPNLDGRFGTRLDRLQRIVSMKASCRDKLQQQGIPSSLSEREIYSGQSGKVYLFEVLCPSAIQGSKIEYRRPGWFASSHEFRVNQVRMSFDFIDSKTGKVIAETGVTEEGRPPQLMLRRLQVADLQEDAIAPWQSINLLNAAIGSLMITSP